jgi:hypothetical protein
MHGKGDLFEQNVPDHLHQRLVISHMTMPINNMRKPAAWLCFSIMFTTIESC